VFASTPRFRGIIPLYPHRENVVWKQNEAQALITLAEVLAAFAEVMNVSTVLGKRVRMYW